MADGIPEKQIFGTLSYDYPVWPNFGVFLVLSFCRRCFFETCFSDVWSLKPKYPYLLSTPLHCVLILVIPEQTEIRDKPLVVVSAFAMHSAETLHLCFVWPSPVLCCSWVKWKFLDTSFTLLLLKFCSLGLDLVALKEVSTHPSSVDYRPATAPLPSPLSPTAYHINQRRKSRDDVD